MPLLLGKDCNVVLKNIRWISFHRITLHATRQQCEELHDGAVVRASSQAKCAKRCRHAWRRCGVVAAKLELGFDEPTSGGHRLAGLTGRRGNPDMVVVVRSASPRWPGPLNIVHVLDGPELGGVGSGITIFLLFCGDRVLCLVGASSWMPGQRP